MRPTRRAALRYGTAVLAWPVLAQARTQNHDGLARLQSAMSDGRFITYQPSQLRYFNGHATPASLESIRADLQLLKRHFDGLITYGARFGAEHIADVAADLGFRAVVVGVWDFYDTVELHNALAAAHRHPKLVVGVSLGNEIILGKRGSWGDLGYMLGRVRRLAPHLPLTVTEPFAQFLDDADAKAVFPHMDFMLTNIHPIFESWFWRAKAANWADFVARAVDLLAVKFSGPILVKETGVPTGPPALHYTPAMQRDFYRALEKRFVRTPMRAFSYFSAFDAPWRVSDFVPGGGVHPEEAHWGLYTVDRAPKLVMTDFPPLAGARPAR